MPDFANPADQADHLQTALRRFAHTSQSVEDPRQIYSVLGSLDSAVVSLSRALQQLASFHDSPSQRSTWAVTDSRIGRTAAYTVSWELHRAAEILQQVSTSIGHAREAEATIDYD